MIQYIFLLLAAVIIIYLLIKYTCNLFGIPEFTFKFIDFLFILPWYFYIPIVMVAFTYLKLLSLPDSITKLIISMYLFFILSIYILAYLIGTPVF